LPTRQYLEPTSCVNQETKAFNRKLGKHVNDFNQTSVMEIKWARQHHTRHGYDLNKKGEDLLMNRIVADIKDLFVKTQRTPIIMSWADGQEVEPQKETTKGKGIGERIRCKDSIDRNEDKPTDSAALKEDQEIHHSKTDGSKIYSNSIEVNQVVSQDEVHQPINHLDTPQAKRSRRPPSKKREFLW
jgi:hypothetical protein